MKVLIVDDETPARNLIKHYLKPFDNIELIGECSNGFEGVKAIKELKPDLIFLDIQMPKLTGFEMLELIEHIPLVVFTTAYDQYAIKAFEANAVDYLLKPFDENRFAGAIEKALQRIDNNKQDNQIKKVIESAQENLQQIVANHGNSIIIIPTPDIYTIEAQDDYVMIYTHDNQYLKKQTMTYYEEHLPENFVRVHRSYIINTHTIANIEPYGKQQYHIKLKNNSSVKTSKSGYKVIREKLSI